MLRAETAPAPHSLLISGTVRAKGSGRPLSDGTVELRWPAHEDRFAPVTAPLREDGSYLLQAELKDDSIDPSRLTVTAMATACKMVEKPLSDVWSPDKEGAITMNFDLNYSTFDGILDVFSCCILSWSVLTVMLPAFLLGAAITAFVPSQYLLNLLGPQAPKPKAYGAAVGSGMVLSLCSCNVVPLFVSIWQSGAGTGPAFSFLFAGPAINLVAITFTCRVIGLPIGIFRVIAVAIMSLVVGLVMARVFGQGRRDGAKPLSVVSMGPDARTTVLLLGLLLYLLVAGSFTLPWLWRGAITAPALVGLIWLSAAKLGRFYLGMWMRETWRLLMKVVPILLPAVILIGFLTQKVPLSATRWFSHNNGWLANGAASCFGALMYFPILTEVPFVKAMLKVMGMGIGPGMAILLTAPGLSLPGMIIVGREIGWKRLAVYVVSIVIMATITGVVFGSEWGAYICSCNL